MAAPGRSIWVSGHVGREARHQHSRSPLGNRGHWQRVSHLGHDLLNDLWTHNRLETAIDLDLEIRFAKRVAVAAKEGVAP